MLRCSFSDKIIDSLKTKSRDVSKCRKIPESLFTHPDFKPSFIKQLRASPMKDDLIFNDVVEVDVIDTELETYATTKALNQTTQPKQTLTSATKLTYIAPTKIEPSIFTYIKIDDTIQSINDIMSNQPDNFKFSNYLLTYSLNILTEE